MTLKRTLISAITLATSLAFGEGQIVAVNSYAAAVNDRVITDGEIQIAAEPQIKRMQQQFGEQVVAQQAPMIFRMTLANLIERALILEEFKSLGYAVPDKAVLQNESNYIEKNFNGDRVKFQEFEKKRKNDGRLARRDERKCSHRNVALSRNFSANRHFSARSSS